MSNHNIIQLQPETVMQTTIWTLLKPTVDHIINYIIMGIICTLMAFCAFKCNSRRQAKKLVRKERVRDEILQMIEFRLQGSGPIIEEVV